MPLKPSARAMLPKGMATLLPEATAFRRRLERAAFDVFQRWGYEEVITPLFEYLDIIGSGLGPGLVEKVYTVTDRASGRMMVLRPDITPQVAKMAATVLREAPRPLRLCYGANVFRYEDEHAGHEREIFQIGAELIGPSHPSADIEIVALAVAVLHELGLKNPTVMIGHVGFFQGWLKATGVRPERAPQLEDAVLKKDRTRVMEFLQEEGHALAQAARFAGLLDLIGGEEVLKRAERLADRAESQEALAYLREVVRQARGYGLSSSIVLDLAEIRSCAYYSGMVFELFASGVGYEIGRGGRYDELIGRFGHDCPSTGFAIHLERIQKALNGSVNASYGAADALVRGGPRTVELAQAFRAHGLRIATWMDGESSADVTRYARAFNIPWLVEASASQQVLLTDLATQRRRRLSLAAAAAVVLGRRREPR